MQIKTPLKFYLTPVRMAKIKKKKNQEQQKTNASNIGVALEKGEHSFPTGERAN